jgi:hypothetical protein
MAISIEHPVDPRQAFDEDSIQTDASKVTLLLLLGDLYGARRSSGLQDNFQLGEEFPIPSEDRGNPLSIRDYIEQIRKRYEIDPSEIRSLSNPEDVEVTHRRRGAVRELVPKLYSQSNREIAAEIILLALGDPAERIRVAAAISAGDMFDNVALPIRALIFFLDDFQDELARQLTEVALHRFGSFSFLRQTPAPPLPPQKTASFTSSIIVHGSFFSAVGGKIPTWWKPRGDFHTYIKDKFCPDLYSKPDFYAWSGGWNDQARQQAAVSLLHWTQEHSLREINVLSHSHGGNVAMWATQLGVEVDKLVLMSCPVHWDRCQPEFARVKNVVSFQIRLDWVILADRGGTYFNQPKITDHMLPQWFWKHADTHSPAIWEQYGLTF